MALEDFFTLTEMKDGLTVPSRVEELVAVMKKGKDCLVKNGGDAMRQWSTVASVIAVTDSKECLDRFIQLDGLLVIDSWLKDAQKFSADGSGCILEESILTLLQALEKFKIDDDRLKSSGICLTVMDLLGHKSNNIQDKAKALLGNLKPPGVGGVVKLDSEEAQAICDDRTEPGNRLAVENDSSISTSATTNDQQNANVDRHAHQLVGDNSVSPGCCVDQQSEGVEGVVKEAEKVASNYSGSDLKEVKDKFESSIRKDTCASEQISASNFADTEQETDVRKEGRILESLPEVGNAEMYSESLSNKFGKSEVYPASVIPKPVEATSSLDKNYVLEADGKTVRDTDNRVDSSGMKSMPADHPTGSTSTRGDESGVLMNCTVTVAQKNPSQGEESRHKAPRYSSVGEVVERVKSDNSHLRDFRGFDSSRGYRSVDVTSKTSAMDLEYGTVDALEVACLVAKEVERQVNEDCDEQFGSFSKKSSTVTPLHLASSSDSFNGKKDQHANGSPFDESPAADKMSIEDSTGEDDSSTNSDDADAEEENCAKVAESSPVTGTAPEAANNADKGTSEIDLNLEISSEAEDDAAGNSVSKSVAVISVARAAAASVLPASPLIFQGDLGWKGTAATSAFRPASPRRTSDGDKTISVEEATDVSRQGQDCVFDLNLLAEDSDDKIINPVWSNKQNQTLHGALSGDLLAEPSPRRSEKLTFDLNQLSEDGDAPFSSSPASSSSSLKPATRNFDLNDGPLNFSDDLQPSLGTSLSHKVNAYGGLSDDSVISIMGAKVKKSPFVHHAPISFFNGGRAPEPSFDANFARPGPPPMSAANAVHYAPSPTYSYNGISVGPAMPFPHPMYGPGGSAAYMVDSRGVSVVPQLMGAPPSSFPPQFAHQPAFTTNMMSPLPGPNGASSSRSPLGFNPGFVIDGANRGDAGAGFRQFIPGQVRSAEEHLQPFYPGIVGGKRKEPDSGWETYMSNYKHHQPPPPHL